VPGLLAVELFILGLNKAPTVSMDYPGPLKDHEMLDQQCLLQLSHDLLERAQNREMGRANKQR
jgi:hypothetical protein